MTVTLVVPGSIEKRSGGYAYDRQIVAGLRARAWNVEVRQLAGDFPHPTSAALDDAARVLAAIPDGTLVLVDGLAFGAMPEEVQRVKRERSRLRFVPIVHLPLALEIGIDAKVAARLEASETRALACASLVVVTGKSTLPILEQYGVPGNRLALVEPGTDRAPIARGSDGAPIQLLSVGALTPGKGHEILFRALASIPHRDWHLMCAGSFDRSPETVGRLRDILRTEGLENQVSLVGELDDGALAGCYDRADVFVLATLRETYGMAVADALARGLPVVSTTTGAIPDLVGRDAGIVVPPGDRHALAAALRRVMSDPSLRERFGDGARRVRDRLPTWDDAVRKMIAAFERFAR